MKLHTFDGSQNFQSLPCNKFGGWLIKDCSTTDRIITLSVRTPDGGTVKIKKNPHCEIIDVKRTLQKIVQFPATSQLLLVNNKICKDEETIFKCCITEDSYMEAKEIKKVKEIEEVKEIKEVELHVICPDFEYVSLKMNILCSIKDTIKEIAKMKNLTGNLSLWLGDKMIKEDAKLLFFTHQGQMELGIDCSLFLDNEIRDTPIHLRLKSTTNEKVVTSCSKEVDDSSTMSKYLVGGGNIRSHLLRKRTCYVTVKRISLGTVITFQIDPIDTSVEVLRSLIESKVGISPDQQRLVFLGRKLEDGRTLHDYNIGCGSVIHLLLQLRGGGPSLYVLDNTGHSVLIETYPYDTVDDVKNRIKKRLGIPPDQQELVIYDERIMGKRDEGRNEDDKSCLIA